MTRTGSFALIVVLGLCAASAATAGSIFGLGGIGSRSAEANETLDSNVDRIELAVRSADVEIDRTDVDRIEVHERVEHWWNEPERTHYVDGDTLTLDDEGCGWGCDIDYVIRVPEGTTVGGSLTSGTLEARDVAAVDVQVTSGELRLTGITGRVSAETTSGSISAERIDGDLRLRTTSGDIEGERLAGGSVDVQATSGDVELELTDPRTVRAEVTSGDVQLTVPDLPYRLTTEQGSGDLETGGLRDDPGSDRALDVRTSSGDVELELGSDND